MPVYNPENLYLWSMFNLFTMGRKTLLPRNPTKAPKRTRAVITAQLRINVIRDYHTSQMTIVAICDRYSICYETCRKILDTTEYKPEDFKAFNPDDVYQRKDIEPLERLRLLTSDALESIEMSLAVMKYKLLREINQTAKNEDKALTLSIKELTMFFAEAAPYVLPKAEKQKLPGKNEKPPRAMVFEMFKKENAQAK